MKFKNLIILFFLMSVTACTYIPKEPTQAKYEKKLYSSKGFALIYSNKNYKNKKIKHKMNNSKYELFHRTLEKDSMLKIVNPLNGNEIEVLVNKNSTFPIIYKVVLSKKIADHLKLKEENPYIEIYQRKTNMKFIAKKAKMFEEEKKIATKAPVKTVLIDEISKTVEIKKDIKIQKYYIIISDFYYLKTAENLQKELKKKGVSSLSIKKVSNNKFRLFSGPFKKFLPLNRIYSDLNALGFNDLDVYTEI